MVTRSVLFALLLGAAGGVAVAWAMTGGPDGDSPGDVTRSPQAASGPGADLRTERLPDEPSDEGPTLVGSPRAAGYFAETKRLNETLRVEVARLEERIAELEPAPADASAFRFGLPEKAPQFDQAKWTDLAGHMLDLSKVLLDLQRDVATTGQPSGKTMSAAMKHNQPLAMFAIAVAPEMGEENANVAYTHPSVIANLIRAALIEAGDPLSQGQEVAIATLGGAWLQEAERVEASFAPGTLELAKLVAEVDGRLRFLDNVKKTILTPSQRAILFHPETEGRLQLDLLSPALVYVFRRPLDATDRADMEQKLLEALFEQIGAEVEDLTPYAWVARQWVDDVPGALEPIPPTSDDVIFPHVDRIQTQARAQVKAIERILGMERLTLEEAEGLRQLTWMFQPFVPLHTSPPESE